MSRMDDLDFEIDDDSDDEIDLSGDVVESAAQEARQYNHELDGILMLAAMLDVENPVSLREFISSGIKTSYLPADIVEAVEWIMSFFGTNNTIPSKTTFRRKFPNIYPLIEDEHGHVGRSLPDCYEAVKHSAIVSTADRGLRNLHQVLADPSVPMTDWCGELDLLHRRLHKLTVASRSQFISGPDILDIALQNYEDAKLGKTYGLPLALPFLDQELLGLPRGNIFTILGEPNVGKTWIALMILLGLVTGDRYLFSSPACWGKAIPKEEMAAFRSEQRQYAVKVLFNSLEMGTRDIIDRLAIMLAKVNYNHYLRGTMDSGEEERFIRAIKAVRKLVGDHLMIGHSTDINQVITEGEAFGAQVIINDAFYLFDTAGEKRWEKVQASLEIMRDHSLVTDVSYVLTTQLDETVKNRAMFAQNIKQDSDIMITARRGPIIELVKARNANTGTMYRFNLDPVNSRFNQSEQVSVGGHGSVVPQDV